MRFSPWLARRAASPGIAYTIGLVPPGRRRISSHERGDFAMDAIVLAARLTCPWRSMLAGVVLCVVACVAGVSSIRTHAEDAAPDFKPADISIGEPLQLPFQQQPATPVPPPSPQQPRAFAPPPAGNQQPAASPPPAATPSPGISPPSAFSRTPAADQAASVVAPAAGTGWLGLSVDDSLIPGRLVIVDVAPQGPAAQAGVAARDTLLAFNGTPLRNADEMAAALAAISPGMDVKMAIGRGDRIDEVVVKATARPREAATRDWQAANEERAPTPPAAMPTPRSPAAVPAPAPRLAAEPQPLPAPARPSLGPAAAKGRTALGVRTVPVDPGVQARFHLPEQTGAFVIGVVHDLPASKAGVPPGSVIVALDNRPVRDPGELSRLVSQGPVGAPVPIQYVLPGGEARRAEVTLQSLEIPLERALTGDERPLGQVPAGAAAPALSAPERRNRVVVQSGALRPTDHAALEDEVRRLRDRVESLERAIEQLTPRRR